MRLFIDEDVDIGILRILKRSGHDAKRVPPGAKNGAVIGLAKEEKRVLITRDSDFTDESVYPPSRHLGIIHLKIHPPWLEKLAPPLQLLLKENEDTDFAGKLFIVEETGHHRVY